MERSERASAKEIDGIGREPAAIDEESDLSSACSDICSQC